MTIEDSRQNFISFIKDYEEYHASDISESDTRSKLIDYIFINILGWDEKNIQREGHVEHGYYDYRFSIPSLHFIVEAKKQLVTLTLPEKNHIASISTLYPENKEIIDQIRRYLVDEGIAFGIITNGQQFIIGQFVNQNGNPWKQNKCLLFNGFDDIKERFITFYNNLSKESFIENGGFKFLKNNECITGKKIVSSLINREKEIVRNSIATNISPIIEEVFGAIFTNTEENDIEFIKSCFVENKETIKNRTELNGLFRDTPPDLANVIGAQNSRSISNQINDEISSPYQPITLKTTPPKPIIIIGSKGAGKTTFINFLFSNNLPETTLSQFPFVYVDFIKYFQNGKIIDTNKISKDILDMLEEKYPQLELYSLKVLKQIYIKEINKNDKGIWSFYKDSDPQTYSEKLNSFLEEKYRNKEEHLVELSKYLVRERRIRLIIIIDNADQLDISIQESAFLFASSLNSRAYCGVIVSLREGYYYKWKNLPPFNAFESNVYHITAPKYTEVLQKRINYALKKIEFTESYSGENHLGYKVSMGSQNIKEFFASLQDSLFNSSNTAIVDFLNYSTFPNIREGLRLFRLFLLSGYTDVEEYILRVRFNKNEDHRITIPIHEFVKTIGLDTKLYYNNEASVIPNLFYPCENSSDHFLKIWILKYLAKKFDIYGNVGKSELLSTLLENFTSYGYLLENVLKEIEFLLHKEFIDTDDVLTDIKWTTLAEIGRAHV